MHFLGLDLLIIQPQDATLLTGDRNAVELIISIIALKQHEVLLVQTSLVGSIISNLLLVTGTSFLLSGLHPQWSRKQQVLDLTVAQKSPGLLILAVGGLMFPSVYSAWAGAALMSFSTKLILTVFTGNDVELAELSRGTSIMLLIIYTCCLILQFKTHSTLLTQVSDDTETAQSNGGNQDVETPGFRKLKVKLLMFLPMQLRRDLLANASGHNPSKQVNLTAGACLLMFVASTTLVSLCAGFLVETINSLIVVTKMSKVFVGLILIPIIGNVAKHRLADLAAYKDKNTLVIGVADSSSIHIALFILPFTVMLGWTMNIDSMTLYFDIFQMAIVFVAVFAVTCTIQEGKSHW